MVPPAVLLALVGLFSSAASERLQHCHSCMTSTANSLCHLRPVRKPETTVTCPERTAHCVVERRQAADGAFLSIERRCSTVEETKQAHNRCERTSTGLRCFTFCYGDYCNRGTGQLYQNIHPWDYDDPEYSDYVYDPEEAVLRRKRPFSGPFPVGSDAFPMGRTVALVEVEVSAAEVFRPGIGVVMMGLVSSYVLAVRWGEE